MICDDVQHPYYLLVRKSVSLPPASVVNVLQDVRCISLVLPKAQYGPFSKLISLLLSVGWQGRRAAGSQHLVGTSSL